MNAPTIIVALLVLAVFVAIIARAGYNKKHHKGGCSCGCGDCPGSSFCHPHKEPFPFSGGEPSAPPAGGHDSP